MKLKLHDNPYVPLYKRVSFLYIPAVFVLITILLEVVMFTVMHLPFPPIYIFSLSIVLIIATIATMVRIKWVQTVICSIFLGWQLFTTISTLVAYQTNKEIFSLETFLTLATAFNNAGAVDVNLLFLIPIITLIVIYIVAVVLIMWYCNLPKKYQYLEKQSLFCGFLAFVSFFSYTFVYSTLPNYNSGYVNNLTSEKFVYDTFSNRGASLQTFGSYSYYLDNLLLLLGGKHEIVNAMGLNVEKELMANQFALSEEEVLGEGNNLIMILMETFERQAINPITTPNLYKFMQQSCVEVNGYYSIERTCITDHINQTGMHPLGKEYWNNYANVEIPHSLANIFKRSNYSTNTFHNSGEGVYNRDKYFTNSLGFDSFNAKDYMTNSDSKYSLQLAFNRDDLLFTENLSKIAPDDHNFYSYVLTVSTHITNAKRYDLHGYFPDDFKFIEEESNWNKLTKIYPVLLSEDPVEVLTAKNYLAGTYNFDRGFGALLNHLKNTDDKLHPGKKLIETTALVMFGDHYYYTNGSMLEAENEDPRNLIGNRCPFIVYNPRQIVDKVSGATQGDNAVKTEPEKCGYTLNRFTSTMDIYPTVCSLFGVKTDQQLTYGRSIFDDAPSVGVAYLTGYTWGAVGYQTSTNRIDMITGEPFIEWQIWKTLDFIHYIGVDLSQEQLDAIAPTVNRVYDSIFLNSKLFESDGFVKLEKAKYQLGKSNLI